MYLCFVDELSIRLIKSLSISYSKELMYKQLNQGVLKVKN